MPLFYTKGEFLKAVENGQRDLVAQYLKKNKSWANFRDKKKETPLHLAAGNGHADIVVLLLEAGAQSDAWNMSCPLHIAALRGYLDVVRIFLAHGWDQYINDPKSYYGTVADCAISSDHVEVLKELLATGKADFSGSKPALYTAALHGSIKCTKELLSPGCNPNECYVRNEGDYHRDEMVSTPPLYKALGYGHPDIALVLLNAGADPNIPQDSDGEISCPLHYVAAREDIEIAEALLTKNADINVQNHLGETPLHIAVKNHNKKMVKFLLEHGAHADIADKKGCLPLSYASQHRLGGDALSLLNSHTAAAATARAVTTAIWQRLGEYEIAHIRTYPELGQKLTEIFNFKVYERITTSTDLESKTPIPSPHEDFATVTTEALTEAWEEFRKQGGVADEERVFRGHFKKLRK